MDKTITSRGGIKLKTAKKYVTEDITVTPVLQNKVITENNVTCVADEGYAGFSSVKVNVSAGADLSVEYSLTPPQSAQGKLWIKGAKPEKTIYTADVVATAVSYSDGSVTMPKTFYNVAAAAVARLPLAIRFTSLRARTVIYTLTPCRRTNGQSSSSGTSVPMPRCFATAIIFMR